MDPWTSAKSPAMKASFLLRIVLVCLCVGGRIAPAQATHNLGAQLTYTYTGSAANPHQYRVTARVYDDASPGNPIVTNGWLLTCGRNECGTSRPGSFTSFLTLTRTLVPGASCQGAQVSYQMVILEATVQLPPARWTLSIDASGRRTDVVNLPNASTQSIYLSALLDNSTGLVNSSPTFTSHDLIGLVGNQAQRFSLSAFDSEGDSLAYALVRPAAVLRPVSSTGCSVPSTATAPPHFQLDASTGELRTVPVPVQQGFFLLDARVNEFRRLNGAWQQIGYIERDMIYVAAAGSNQAPAFTRVAYSNSPTGQLLGQVVPANTGQTVTLQVTATDPDAGQVAQLSSEAGGIVPGVTFQNQGNGRGLLTWQVPALLPAGRYYLTVQATDNACPAIGVSVLTIPFAVTQQMLAARPRQALAQAPYPVPFREEVRFQLATRGAQPVLVFDGLGRVAARLTAGPDGSVVWRPADDVAPGLYLARNLSGSQVAHLSYAGR